MGRGRPGRRDEAPAGEGSSSSFATKTDHETPCSGDTSGDTADIESHDIETTN